MALGQDEYGYVATGGQAALDLWTAGLDHALTFDHSGIPELRQAVSLDPDFALARAMLGRQKMIHGDRKSGLVDLDSAQKLAHGTNARERSLVSILNLAARGQERALASALDHLETWPTDILAFSTVVGPFGLLAFNGRTDWREANILLMQKYRSRWPKDHWWYLANESFSQVEGGMIREGRARAERAWDVRPTGTAAHSLSHAHIEDHAQDDGLAFVEMWLAGPGVGSDMRHHINWHKSIFEFDMGLSSAAHSRQHFETSFSAGVSDPMPLSTFSDNASFLWRARLRDYPIPAEFIDETIAYMDRHYQKPGFVFADIHRICAIALSGDKARLEQLRTEFRALADGHNTAASRLTVTLCAAFTAFADDDFAAAAYLLAPILAETVLLGGSNPQRRIVEETFIAACTKASVDPQAILSEVSQ